MEVFKCNQKKNKWYQKINWPKVLIIFIVSFLIFYLFFYYISNAYEIDRVFLTSLIISILITINYIFNDIIENRDRVFIINKSDIGYIEIHKELSGKFLKSSDFNKIISKEDIEEIYLKNHLFEGIDRGIIKSINYLKKKNNCIVIKAKTDEKIWKSVSRFTISKIYLVNRIKNKKIIIPNDYEENNKIYKYLKERYDKNV